MHKKSRLIYSAKFCVEIPQVQYIDLSEIVRVVKVIVIVTRVHSNFSTLFVISHKMNNVLTKWRLNTGFGTQKKPGARFPE